MPSQAYALLIGTASTIPFCFFFFSERSTQRGLSRTLKIQQLAALRLFLSFLNAVNYIANCLRLHMVIAYPDNAPIIHKRIIFVMQIQST